MAGVNGVNPSISDSVVTMKLLTTDIVDHISNIYLDVLLQLQYGSASADSIGVGEDSVRI